MRDKMPVKPENWQAGTSLAPDRMPRNGAMNSKNFFAELKRRKVYKVGIAYAVVAWVLMQVASQIFPFFEIPNWAVRLVVLLLIIGFPVALILAWAFELTPEGIKRTEDVEATKPIAFKTRNLTTMVGEGPEKEAAMPFTATHWSMVLDAQSELRAARDALEKLCRIYWRPVYSFVQRQGIGPDGCGGSHPGFLRVAIRAQRSEYCPQGEEADFVLICLHRLKIFWPTNGVCDGNQARQRTALNSVGGDS